jgi:hypothetical protein
VFIACIIHVFYGISLHSVTADIGDNGHMLAHYDVSLLYICVYRKVVMVPREVAGTHALLQVVLLAGGNDSSLMV